MLQLNQEPAATGSVVEQRDSSVVEQWDLTARVYRRYDCGDLVEERPFTDAENAAADGRLTEQTRQKNRAQLLARARAAFTNNGTYLTNVKAGTATNADHIAQVAALTRQMQAVIRLVVGADLLDDSTTQET